jgi:hypothetical protein
MHFNSKIHHYPSIIIITIIENQVKQFSTLFNFTTAFREGIKNNSVDDANRKESGKLI